MDMAELLDDQPFQDETFRLSRPAEVPAPDELFYCNCGNKGPDGAECPHCHSHFALESHRSTSSGLAHLSTILIGVFLGIVVGVSVFTVATPIILTPGISTIGTIAFACPIIGGVLGNKIYKSRERGKREKA